MDTYRRQETWWRGADVAYFRNLQRPLSWFNSFPLPNKQTVGTSYIVKDVGMRNEASPESIPLSIPSSIRPIMVCLLRRGKENSGVQTLRMLKPDLDSESV